MGSAQGLPRGYFWPLVFMQALVLAPHLFRVPVWVGLFWLLCVLWSALALHRGSRAPAAALKAGLVMLAALLVGVEYGLGFSLEPAVDMLLLAFALKLLEVREQRDLRVLLLLALFVLGAQFLYEQGMGMAAWQLFVFVIIMAGLIGLQQRPQAALAWRPQLTTATVLVLQALPLAVLLFVFFPRLDPLWAVPLPESGARSGLSETMSPGDIARLGQSRALAYRVEFEGQAPATAELYWRVMTYHHYEDGSWSQGTLPEVVATPVVWHQRRGPAPQWLQAVEGRQPAWRYSVLAEPSQQPWLIALDVAVPEAGTIGVGRDFRLLHDGPVRQRVRYAASSVDAGMDLQRPAWLEAHALQLPEAGNPRARAWAETLRQEQVDATAIAETLLRHFATEPFSYTLTPPRLGDDDIDDFLFETRSGFCAHFAGAFVFLMRAAGVPARVVAGYHGGELNPVGSHWLVRQADAHAWAEIWLPDTGWVQVDPTTAVAPERIELGADGYQRESAVAGSGMAAEGEWWRRGMLLDAYFLLEMLEHRWNLFVIDYDGRRQLRLLQRLLGEVTPWRVLLAVSAGMLVALAWVLAFWWPVAATRRSPLQRLDRRLGALGECWGLPRQPHESPAAYGRRLAPACPPALLASLRDLGEGLEQALYDPQAGVAGVQRAREGWQRLRWHYWRGRVLPPRAARSDP